MSRPIDREGGVQDFLDRVDRQEKKVREISAEQSKDAQLKEIAELKNICGTLRRSNPEYWGKLEEKLVRIHAFTISSDRVTPIKCTHPESWALGKAYTQGQLDILLELFRNLEVDPQEVARKLLTLDTPRKSFIRNLWTLIRFLLKRS